MPREGKYYLARLSKIGVLDNKMIIDAFSNPKPIECYGNAWTILDAKKLQHKKIEYVYARLVKYQPDGEVPVVDPESGTEDIHPEPNMRIASSPFIYIPSHSGIAFLKVSQDITEQHFVKRMAKLIEDKHLGFFMECEINLIFDLATFSTKLKELTSVYTIQANVFPPNPLYGSLWKSLREYLKNRNNDKMSIMESTQPNKTINTELTKLVELLSGNEKPDAGELPEDVPIGDAATLMAADGYGNATVKGKVGKKSVTIKTKDTDKSFPFKKDPEPEELFLRALEEFQSIEISRHMEHGK